ncbi:hypothetical protein SAMN04487854_10583 [Pseudoalteromonas lipolytica]|uniref:Uncharacterized protein n=1 Tax=Pseudoalteromonas lipolytica TaxID=570156 RepID=A0ABY1GIU0_9GAMM|nr:hypothetical protein SAMN04487854_10583 [Pseudoalteromonas lipolytica]
MNNHSIVKRKHKYREEQKGVLALMLDFTFIIFVTLICSLYIYSLCFISLKAL